MRTTFRAGRVALAGLALATAAATAHAQTLDRTKAPAPGPTPQLHVPTWTATTLPDGALLVVSPRRNLPLVSFEITFIGGAAQYEPADERGLAGFVAEMMSEGTKTRTGDQLSNALQLLGTDVSVGIGDESGSIGFVSMKDKFQPVLAIVEDMLVNPTFPSVALERLRARTLVSLQQQRDQTPVVARNVFARTVYSPAHPYGRVVTAQSVKAITRDDIVRFHDAYFQPGRAIITVVGDVDPTEVQATIERTLARWPAGGTKPSFAYPPLPAQKPTTIYLVDKPGAAQSSFAIGLAGPPRDTPDFYALEVMNTMLGGMFQSRLNADIREQKGYSYGVGSRFAFGKGPGPFRAGGDVVTAKTDSALIEFMKQLRGIQGAIPVSDEEMQTARAALVQSLPERFASVSSVAGSITALYLEGLPTDYFQHFAEHIDSVTKDDVVRVARKYIDMDHLAIVIVGDRKRIEEPLRKTGIAPIVVLNVDGDPVKTAESDER